MKTANSLLILLMSVCALAPVFGQTREDAVFATGEHGGDPIKTLSIYPNPAFETLNIRFETPCAKRVKLSLHNLIGNTLEVETENIDEHELQIKVGSLPSGYYLISVRDPDSNFKSTYKFLKR